MKKGKITKARRKSILEVLNARRIALVSAVVAIVVVFGLGNKPGDSFPCANTLTCKGELGEKIENGAFGEFGGKAVMPPQIAQHVSPQEPMVLGESVTPADKHIYVDLTAQKLFAYEGDNKVFETLTSTGRWGRTPTGNFNIWIKLRSTRMSGGSGADYYNLPNVPYTMFYYGDFGIHGAYWHNNFGYTMSHGCVNLRQIDAEVLFNWAEGPKNGQKGTPVSVCDTFVGPNNCEQRNPVK